MTGGVCSGLAWRAARRRTTRSSWVSAWHSTHARVVGRHRHLCYIDQFHVEDQISLGRNHRVGGVGTDAPLCSIGQLPGNEEAALAADLHAIETLVPARNDAAKALGKSDGLRVAQLGLSVSVQHRLAVLVRHRSAVIGRGIEFLPVVVTSVVSKPACVVDLIHLVGHGIRSSADFDLLVTERKGNLLDARHNRNPRRQFVCSTSSSRRFGACSRLGCGCGGNGRFSLGCCRSRRLGSGLCASSNRARHDKQDQMSELHWVVKLPFGADSNSCGPACGAMHEKRFEAAASGKRADIMSASTIRVPLQRRARWHLLEEDVT